VSGAAREKKLTDRLRAGQAIVASAVDKLRSRAVTEAEIRVRHRSRRPARYDGVEALRGLNLMVPAGSICGLLDRTGAGKTTTIKILLGMARPTAGRASVFGLAADAPAS
jgi:ABC-type uncharacterized transport system ATPase subunit